VNHELLIKRLSDDFGLVDKVEECVRLYVMGRNQSVRIGSSEGVCTHCTMGVPQGSVRRPLLFSAYVSPMPTDKQL
jgi:hypothetical protein